MTLPRPGLGQPADPRAHRQRHPDRAQSPVVAADRVVEEHHQTVAGEPLERALEPEDQVAERLVVLREDAHHLLGLARLGERREAAHVAEHDHDLAAVALEERLVARVDDQLRQLGRQEPPQTAHPLQLGDLRLDTGLQLAVPGSQLVGLALDRVLVALDPGQGRHPGQQLALVDRLGQEVVGAGLQGLHLLLVAARGDHHDRQVGGVGLLADPAAHLVAVHAGHHDVQEDEVDLGPVDRLQRLLAGLADARRSRAGVKMASSSLMLAGWSSTTSTRGGRGGRIVHVLPPSSMKSRTCWGSARALIGFST